MGLMRDINWRAAASGVVIAATIIAGYIVSRDMKQSAEDDYESRLPVEKVVIELQSGGLHTFDLEIASRPVDIETGLMFRKQMDKDRGMLFLLGKEPRVTSFWMKNTYIPLDMLFVAQDGKIVNIYRNAQPHSLTSIPSGAPVTGVIELNAGRADETGIRFGDRVLHGYFLQPAGGN